MNLLSVSETGEILGLSENNFSYLSKISSLIDELKDSASPLINENLQNLMDRIERTLDGLQSLTISPEKNVPIPIPRKDHLKPKEPVEKTVSNAMRPFVLDGLLQAECDTVDGEIEHYKTKVFELEEYIYSQFPDDADAESPEMEYLKNCILKLEFELEQTKQALSAKKGPKSCLLLGKFKSAREARPYVAHLFNKVMTVLMANQDSLDAGGDPELQAQIDNQRETLEKLIEVHENQQAKMREISNLQKKSHEGQKKGHKERADKDRRRKSKEKKGQRMMPIYPCLRAEKELLRKELNITAAGPSSSEAVFEESHGGKRKKSKKAEREGQKKKGQRVMPIYPCLPIAEKKLQRRWKLEAIAEEPSSSEAVVEAEKELQQKKVKATAEEPSTSEAVVEHAEEKGDSFVRVKADRIEEGGEHKGDVFIYENQPLIIPPPAQIGEHRDEAFFNENEPLIITPPAQFDNPIKEKVIESQELNK
ncbi:hypothetical protein CEXT_773161 [Caerostris extrusa]|uniref:Uncharacterized protein n=1 Tax=Caerostris extrusa TaxID=172846 RepID=A0AAV4QJE4_CAEEX|nr:hypothetical protein CEXT_773161 [Caerostris extrusa]